MLSCFERNHSKARGDTNVGLQFSLVTKFFNLLSNIFGFTVWDLINVNFLGPTILRWALDVWGNCVLLFLINQKKYFSVYITPL